MATTPLKTASRALSLATLVVAGFSGWLYSTQGTAPCQSTTEFSPERTIEFAAVVEPTPTTRSQNVVSKTAPRRRLDEGLAQPVSRPAIDDDAFFEDEIAEPTHLADSDKNRRAAPSQSQARIQPELGRLSARESNPVTTDDRDDRTLTIEDALRQPNTPRTENRPAAVFRPADAMHDAESARVESQLTSLQKKIDQLAQAQTEQKTNDLQKALETLQQIQESKQSEQFEKLFQQLKESKQNGADPSNPPEATQESPKPETPKSDAPPEFPEDETPAANKKPGSMRFEPTEGQRDRFDNIDFDDVDISKALAALGQLSGINILVGRGVAGVVPAANLQNVTAEEALDAITKSLGYVYEREGNFVFVWTAADALARKQAARRTVQKVFRPRYVSVRDLQMLITPMLSKPGGLIAVTNPAEVGLEESKTKVGGNSLAQTDALLVVDFPEVIAQIEMVVADIDVPPSQVVIEAMILSVKLEDSMKLGVNFALLNGDNKQLVTTGSGSQLNNNVGFNKNTLIPIAGDFVASTAGLKYGFINGDLTGFVEALERLAETSVVASPSVRVLNKQRAELIIGQRLGYKTTTFNGTQSIENINFLEVGTKLLLRPFVAQDGLVRMEIHPEKSTGVITDGLPQSTTTEVTSNVMIRDGSTIVIGGLIEEQANQTQSRVPGLGALPVVGNLFKNKENATTRTELIVLITPRIIHDPEAAAEGDLSRTENERRHQEYRDKLSPINRNNLARIEYERAARYFDEGDVPRAKRHIDESLRHNRLDQDSLRLRDQIVAALNDKNWWKKLRRKPPMPYHNVPPTQSVLPGNAVFEQEIPAAAPTSPPILSVPPAPLAPAPSTDEPAAPPPSAKRSSNGRTSRS